MLYLKYCSANLERAKKKMKKRWEVNDEYRGAFATADSRHEAMIRNSFAEKYGKQSLRDLIEMASQDEISSDIVDEPCVAFDESHHKEEKGKISTSSFRKLATLKRQSVKKPSANLKLHIISQMKMNYIIATEIVGRISLSDMGDSTKCEFAADEYKRCCDRWKIPFAARQPFLLAAVKVFFIAGEQNVQEKGRDALDELDSVQLSNIYAPVLTAMGHSSDVLETWLASTEGLMSSPYATMTEESSETLPT
uniref:Uncharacterized protein n=2 Tax=Leptocylindrus danicus TaxID=163516 RepID=A0A7S2LUK9_9STRA|mmetsp:Transcript_9402/g.14141  ORF Transcript_9402/g.14141 Transcript_9402/m.14141 type:complete len:251 (+) Transcript_9402:36-788(+)